jgi:hypothetical protein
MIKTILTTLAAALLVSCSSGENDGRKYATSNASPVAGKMGVTYRRVQADNAPPATPAQPRTVESDGLLGAIVGGGAENEPPGLLDRNDKPDEPGAEYWLNGQNSPNPVAGKMGVRVTRQKK